MKHQIIIAVCLFWGTNNAAQAQSNRVKLFTGQELSNQYFLNSDGYPDEQPTVVSDYGTNFLWGVGFEHHRPNGRFWDLSARVSGLFKHDANAYFFSDTITNNFFETYGKSRNGNAQLQLELNRPLCSEPSSSFKPYFGWFVRSSTTWIDLEPSNSFIYPIENWETKLSGGFVPRLQVALGRRFGFDFSLPVNLVRFGLESRYTGNPVLTPSQQKSQSFDFSIDLEPQFRFGMNYKLGL